MSEKNRYAFVILNWNGKQDTEICLKSLDNITYDHKFDIIVVDNGSIDGSLPYLKNVAKDMSRDVTFVPLETNRGFTGGHIVGLQHTDADIVCLLNNDAVVAQNILQDADTIITNIGPKFGAIGGRAYFWNETHEAFDIWSRFFTFQKIDPITATAYTIEGDPNESLAPKIVDNVSGACVFVNRQAIDKVGYLDDVFFAYYEETDLFARFKRFDYEIYYCPTIRYWHRFDPNSGSHGASSKHIKNFSTKLIARNQFYFALRNFESKYLFKFLAWYYFRFLTSPLRILIKPGTKDVELIIIRTTLTNLIRIPQLLRSRGQLLKGSVIGYNTKIIQQAQLRTVVFLKMPHNTVLDYILKNTESNNRVHLRTSAHCAERFNHRCVILNSNKNMVNSIAAASTRTEFTIIINDPSVSRKSVQREFTRSSNGKAYRKFTPEISSFNKEFVSQIVGEEISLNKVVDWTQKARSSRVSNIFRRLTGKPLRMLSTLVNYFNFRFRTGGKSELVRSILGLVKNSLLKPKATLLTIRAGAHEELLYNKRMLQHSKYTGIKLENFIVADIPVFINCRDRVDTLKKTISAIENAGLKRIYLIDNQSSYSRLLEYYATTKYQVIPLGENMGHKAPWESKAVKLISGGSPYIVTDPDVVLSENYSEEIISKMLCILDEYPGYVKIGPSLSINDLPDHYEHKKTVQKWEKQFWNKTIKTSCNLLAYDAEIDTTFAIYRQNLNYITLPSIRIGEPYSAKHLPWYENSKLLDEEGEYYKQHASSAVNTWNKDILPDYLKKYSD